MYRFSSRSRSIENQGPSPSLDFVELTLYFAMHCYQLNLAFALVGWFCVRTIATNLNLVEWWFDRLLIELDWRIRWLIRSRERPRRKPPNKTTNKKKRNQFKRVTCYVVFAQVSYSSTLFNTVTFSTMRNTIESCMKRNLLVPSTCRSAMKLTIDQSQKNGTEIAAMMSIDEDKLNSIERDYWLC